MGVLALLLLWQEPAFLPHPDDSPFWFSGQANFIFQAHPGFDAKYSGPNSLQPFGEAALSGVITLYTGARLYRTTEVLLDAESAQGGGVSTALGLAGFTNLDVVRNPTLGSEPYVGRIELHQIIPLSDRWLRVERTPLSGFAELPDRRIEIRIGKFSTVDVFDLNGVGSDSHLQFMNWTVDNNGAFDYAADTRGYTYALTIEYFSPQFAARFGEMTMPAVANGIDFDFDYLQARGENFEVEWRHASGIVRALAWVNHARMGLYRDAIAMPNPDITATRKEGRVKYGFGLNAEQGIGRWVRVFGRAGWNDGATESFAYTEVDDTIQLGGDVRGGPWHREDDKVGLAFVSNGISEDHCAYLAAGGDGFLLGDGRLTYGRETIVETYYNAHVWRGFFAAGDLQFVANPGYNQDRGPVWVFSLRAHFEF